MANKWEQPKKIFVSYVVEDGTFGNMVLEGVGLVSSPKAITSLEEYLSREVGQKTTVLNFRRME